MKSFCASSTRIQLVLAPTSLMSLFYPARLLCAGETVRLAIYRRFLSRIYPLLKVFVQCTIL